MDTVRQYRNEILRKCLCICVFVCLSFIAFRRTELLRGFLLGAGVSMVNFHLLAVDMTRFSILELKRFPSFMILRFFLRYGLIALAVYVSFLYGLNIILFAGGLFLVQLIIIVDNLSKMKQTI